MCVGLSWGLASHELTLTCPALLVFPLQGGPEGDAARNAELDALNEAVRQSESQLARLLAFLKQVGGRLERLGGWVVGWGLDLCLDERPSEVSPQR